LFDGGPHFNVMTSASFSSPVTVCLLAISVDNPEDFARLRILHREGSQLVDRTILAPASPAPDFASRTICARVDVPPTDFYFTLGPTNTVSGKVLTPNGVTGLRNAVVILTDYRGVKRTATTGSLGIYTFEGVRSGETYIVSVSSKRYRFTPQLVTITANLTGLDLIGLE